MPGPLLGISPQYVVFCIYRLCFLCACFQEFKDYVIAHLPTFASPHLDFHPETDFFFARGQGTLRRDADRRGHGQKRTESFDCQGWLVGVHS